MEATIGNPPAPTPASNEHQRNVEALTHLPTTSSQANDVSSLPCNRRGVRGHYSGGESAYRWRHNPAIRPGHVPVESTPESVTVVHTLPPAPRDWSVPGSTQALQDAIIMHGQRISQQALVGHRDQVRGQMTSGRFNSPSSTSNWQGGANLHSRQELDLQKPPRAGATHETI